MFLVYSWNDGADTLLISTEDTSMWRPFMVLEYSGTLAECNEYLDNKEDKDGK